MQFLWSLLAIFFIVVLIDSIKKFFQKRKYIKQVNQYHKDLSNLKQTYISYNDLEFFKKQYSQLQDVIFNKYYHDDDFQSFLESYANLDQNRNAFNELFINKELIKYDSFFSNIDEKSLDNQQRTACIVNEDANLVIAGAGSGKTLTICGKVKYLLDKGVPPEKILCISFTNKVCEELKERLKKISGQSIEVLTFHKTALQILKQCGEHRNIADENQSDQILQKVFNGLRNKDAAIQDLYALVCAENYIKNHIDSSNNDSPNLYTIKNLIDHVYEIRKLQCFMRDSIKLETLSTEKVKSQYELDIANFLFLNGIDYEYEQPYQFEEDDEDKFDYKPDFFLPEYNIYIEHFGIDENGKASWLIDEKKINKYSEEMNAKIAFHEKKNNTLICTYSYEKEKLLTNLYEKLSILGVEFNPCSRQVVDLFNQISDYNSFMLNTITSFIKLFKSKGYSMLMFDLFLSDIEKNKLTIREKQLLSIIKKVYYEYQKILDENNLMDFDDIINLANKLIQTQNISSKYKYIIVDEYQDVSINKVVLLKNLMNIENAKLMSVGDDWQSIYRFAGSEVSLISNFEQVFPHSVTVKIEHVYRNAKDLIDISSGFIQKNNNQIKKNLISEKRVKNPIEIISFNDKLILVPKNLEERLNEDLIKSSLADPRYFYMISVLDKIAEENHKKVLLLSRNNEDYAIIKLWIKNENSNLLFKKNPTHQLVFYYKDIEVTCMTIHKSKGLEADDVILFNIREGNRGLPDTLGDGKILRVVTSSVEPIEYAEDRRLFYVALTRTKGKTYIINNIREQSRFINELIASNKTIVNDCNDNLCPICNGYLVRIDQYDFYGCSNYSLKKCPFKLFAKSHKDMVEKNSALHKIIPKLQSEQGIRFCGKIINLAKQIAPLGNLCLKIEFELSFDNVILGNLTVYINKTNSKIEELKLTQFLNAISQSHDKLDPFENFNKFDKQYTNKKLLVYARSDNYGQSYELCNQNNIYFSSYKK